LSCLLQTTAVFFDFEGLELAKLVVLGGVFAFLGLRLGCLLEEALLVDLESQLHKALCVHSDFLNFKLIETA